ncbi:MAG: hypothetical protein WB402_10395 [Sulfuricaulis sp.]|uniref:hypothetical protein n=1 Tax=Sulfuricaulis sp. TaxID=2003553 RepID=UPI003C4E90E9
MKLFSVFAKNRLYIPLLLTVFLSLLASRRWQQLISPQVWDEDGAPNPWLNGGLGSGSDLADYIHKGWSAFFEPVNGYLVTVPKIISAISLWVSFSNYPIVSTIFTWLFIALVGLAITLAPTHIRAKFLCTLAVFMIPSDPEVYGIPLYTFWWSSLFLFLVALWDEKRPSLKWRLGLLLVGGLSSPVIVLILPVLYFRAYWYRSLRSEQLVAFIATLAAAVQISFIVKGSAGHFPPLDSVLMNVIPTFYGRFLIGNWVDNKVWLWLVGMGLTGIIAAWLLRDRRNVSAWILLYLLAGTVVLTVVRVDPAGIHPRLAGPRYFFLPFVLTFWILIQYFHAAHSKWLRSFIGIVTVTAVINAAPVWSRQHDDLRWTDHVRSCRLFPSYTIPVQFDGNRSSAWSLKLSGNSCAELLERDFLISTKEIDERSTFAYTVLKANVRDKGDKGREAAKLISSTMTGTDFQKSNLKGYRVIGSFNSSDADTGEVLLKLHRGDHVLYRSGPGRGGHSMSIVGHEPAFIAQLPIANDWETLEFSNTKLPAEFVLKIKDEGREFGEWSAIAIIK